MTIFWMDILLVGWYASSEVLSGLPVVQEGRVKFMEDRVLESPWQMEDP